MTTAADDPAVEEAFEAYLAGRPVPEQGAGVAAFAAAVRSTATRPGRPNAALAELLADGLLIDRSPSSATALPAGMPPASRPRARRRIAMLFPALVAKMLSAGAVAQAATGAGIALVAFTGAGTAGVLPDPLQHGFATVADTVGIDAIDPLEADEGTTSTGEPTSTGEGTSTEDDADLEGTDGTEGAGGTEEKAPVDPAFEAQWQRGPEANDQTFSEWVSDGARHHVADGATISRFAHEKKDARDEETTQAPEEPSTDTATAPAPEESDSSSPATGNGGGNGGGNQSGNGGAGGGHGNAGGNGGGHGSGNR